LVAFGDGGRGRHQELSLDQRKNDGLKKQKNC
jgi:hypothetical protein